MGRNRKKDSSGILLQGTILAAASFISRIIGLIYRVPMTSILGDVGNDYYSCAFEIYNVVLLISSFSLPLAVSKLVSARVAKGEIKNAYRIVTGAFFFALVSGVCAGFLVYFGAEYITGLLKTPMSVYALRVLAPTLAVVAVLGVLRGFFQGLGTMLPSAMSQVIEQIINAVVSVGAAYYLYGYGEKVGRELGNAEKYGAAYGAAGGTLGTGMGAVAAFVFMGIVFLLYRKKKKPQIKTETNEKTESYREILKILALTILPVLLSTTIYNISGILDQGIFKNMAYYKGHTSEEIEVWWGVFTGKYKLLINVPISISSALAASCVPGLAASFANQRMDVVRRQIHTVTRFILMLALPCTVGMIALASPIMQLLFRDSSPLAESLLQIGAAAVLFYSISTLSNGILQGIGQMKIPVRNAAIALVLHLIVLGVLLGVFDWNIYAVVLANMFFAFLMCLQNQYAIRRFTGFQAKISQMFLPPLVSSLIMGIVVKLSYKGIFALVKGNTVACILSIIIGVLVYGLCMLRSGISEEELFRLPAGRKLVHFLKRLRLI